jgi:hypothetical protein
LSCSHVLISARITSSVELMEMVTGPIRASVTHSVTSMRWHEMAGKMLADQWLWHLVTMVTRITK